MTPPKKPTLDAVQGWMQSVVTHPRGVEAGVASEAARAHLEVAPAEVESVIDRSLAQSSIERLGVYAGAYHARLIECLEAEFPVFRQAVGAEAFAEFAVEYLKRYPSHSYTLAQLATNFPKFLEETKSSASSDHSPIDWPEFLVDLALLERAFSEVFDGPGIEEKQTLSAAELLTIDPRHWPQARLTVVPCLRLLELRFPLNDYYTAGKQGREPPLPKADETWLAVTRRDYIVRRYELTRTQFVLLDELRNGQTLADAMAAAVDTYPESIESLAVDVRHWFEVWAAAPMFESIRLG